MIRESITYASRTRVSRDVSRLVAYDNGYLHEFETNRILIWDDVVNSKMNQGVISTLVTGNLYTPITKYIKQIEGKYVSYLHYLFRQAIKVKGHKVGVNEIELVMNKKRHINSES